MNYLWIASVLLCLVTVYGSLTCPKRNERCTCLPGSEFEYHCPPNSVEIGGVVIHIKQDLSLVTIDCYPLMTSTTVSSDDQHPNITSPKFFDVDILPDAKIGKINRLEIRFCPLPKLNFKEIVEKLSITGLKYLKFASSDMESIRLSGSYFEGLETLETLVIDKNKLLILEDDVFDNTPNLLDIELTESYLKMSSEVFKKIPRLKGLDISGNHLEELPEGLFRPLKNLSRLHLWNNNLTSIDESTFEDLSNLKSLELSVNNIKSISENAFRNLRQLLQINFYKNNLDLIPASLFQGNPMLQKVKMRRNPTLKLPDYLLSNLSSLVEVDLCECNLESVPEHIFEKSLNLSNISFSNNRLKSLPETLFESLQNLEKVELQFNLFEDVPKAVASLSTLKELNLANNFITTLHKGTFGDLRNLERLNLNRNRISQINFGTFDDYEMLRIVQLSHNLITAEIENPVFFNAIFQNSINLEEIDLSYNLITQIENVIAIENKVRLNKIDLRFNRITNITLASLKTIRAKGKLLINLENNNITFVDFNPFTDSYNADHLEEIPPSSSYNDLPYSEIRLANNPLSCDCHNYELLKYFQQRASRYVQTWFDIPEEDLTCANPVELKGLQLATLPPQLLSCPLEEKIENYNGCSGVCSCYWRPFDESVVIDCSNKNLSKYPEIVLPLRNKQLRYQQSEVHLENNFLKTGPDSALIGYWNVTKLYLSNNKISTIKWLPPSLQILKLDNNKLRNLDFGVLKTLNTTNLSNLTLAENPWLCECASENLTEFFRHRAKQIDDIGSVYCANSSIRLINLNKKDLCLEWDVSYVIVPVMTILLTSAVLVALYYRYQKELKIWLYAKNLCLWWVSEEDLDKDKIYDAFISYSHKDEDFVIQNLLPRLENGPKPYKLCLHYRNWVAGEFIAKQVTNSVLESRRTLVVLSPNFLESVWGKLEFRTAHTQAMTEGRARVIIVLYGDVDVNSLDGELKAYLKTNTYVKWGEPYFWNKLIYALPHSRRNISQINQKHANVMSCIDDKFQLVVPVTASPGSTPPVLTLDATSLKKHPLNFVPSSEMDTPPAEAGSLLTSTCL